MEREIKAEGRMSEKIVNIKIPVGDIMQNMILTVDFHVTGMRWLAIKLSIAKILLRGAARVLGCGINFTMSQPTSENNQDK